MKIIKLSLKNYNIKSYKSKSSKYSVFSKLSTNSLGSRFKLISKYFLNLIISSSVISSIKNMSLSKFLFKNSNKSLLL